MNGKSTAAMASIAVLAAMAMLPLTADKYLMSTASRALVYMAAAGMWGFMVANAEMISLGPQMFIGLGSYTVAILSNYYGVPIWASIAAAAGISAAIGYGLSYPLLRLRGLYFAIASLLVSQIFMMFFLNWDYAGGAMGISITAASNMSISGIYYHALAVAAVAAATMYLVYYSKMGYGLRAAGADEEAAEDIGVNPFRMKATLFVIHAAITAAAGGVNAINKVYLYPLSEFSPIWIAELMFSSVMGGMGTIVGSALGSALYVYLQTVFASQVYISLLLMGTIVLVILVVIPDGIWGYLSSRLKLKPPI